MIRRLRWKMIAITTVLLTVVLGMILGFVYYSTWSGLYSSSLSALETAGGAQMRPGRPGSPDSAALGRCFILELKPNGTLSSLGPDYFDLSDPEELLELLEAAQDTGGRIGVLEDEQLRFLKLEAGLSVKYVFMDISSEVQTLSRLVTACIVIFVAGLVGFFCISVLLARWAVRPVEQAWEQQRQFVADASHELKTPLTVILTNAELLTDPDQDDRSRERSAGSILTMSRQMRGLVEELLDQARVDNGTVQAEMEPLDLSKLVSDAVLPFEPVYFEAGRSLESQIQPGVGLTGSAGHLRRVVDILLDNGCKYSTPGGTVLLRLERQHRGCLLSVTSPGAELSEEQCRDIFKRFYRADSARKMDHSYGLGLSIAQGIVEKHKGKIWAQSGDGYNTFFVILPTWTAFEAKCRMEGPL